jgi:hypothetical protein
MRFGVNIDVSNVDQLSHDILKKRFRRPAGGAKSRGKLNQCGSMPQLSTQNISV